MSGDSAAAKRAARPRHRSDEPRVKETDERYTPRPLINLITAALGPIFYDPATTKDNPVGARAFSALPENGLLQDWKRRARGGLTYVNSPFSVGNLPQWAGKVVDEARGGLEIVQLTPVDPSTDWYEVLVEHANLLLGLKERQKYDKPAGEVAFNAGAMQPAMLWYFGARARQFARAMAPYAHASLPGVFG